MPNYLHAAAKLSNIRVWNIGRKQDFLVGFSYLLMLSRHTFLIIMKRQTLTGTEKSSVQATRILFMSKHVLMYNLSCGCINDGSMLMDVVIMWCNYPVQQALIQQAHLLETGIFLNLQLITVH